MFFVVVVVFGEGVLAAKVRRKGAGVFGEVSAEDGELGEGEKAVEVDFG